ncbi:hypothetical protein EK0264_03665 [Epidermidibacterium keratini]|uniref:Uncharacterized protein n=1 Tax=Epidermidibacterium keratini TaxID=1891644 RepID=A0A7L4YK84_9ACTN|nr:hypothetical protein [Epidermidibacterium keratini]QHB99467.1 hypothetical protein EK0264_03665 [Epidermidibacterium keratini]
MTAYRVRVPVQIEVTVLSHADDEQTAIEVAHDDVLDVLARLGPFVYGMPDGVQWDQAEAEPMP